MCGIAGIVTQKQMTKDLGEFLLASLSHRGPDNASRRSFVFNDERTGSTSEVILCHTRLSIIDLSDSANQPMSDDTGRFHLVFNGEIYNYLELRSKLESEGVTFTTKSDTEVLLKLLAREGEACLPRLIGMFAFAFLDREQRTLLVARDQFGIKPFYYSQTPEAFYFASEPAPLLAAPGVTKTLDIQAAHDFLTYGESDHSNRTFFRDIRQLPPAHSLLFNISANRAEEPKKFWEIQDEITRKYDANIVSEIRERFLTNVKLHLRSDVPVGAALSGGIDSSSIVMAIRELTGSSVELHCFGYVSSDPKNSEERWMRLVADAANANMHIVRVGDGDVVSLTKEIIARHGEPFGTPGVLAQYELFKTAQKAGIKVMLDGQGADELFAGYTYFRGARLASLIKQGKISRVASFIKESPSLSSRIQLVSHALDQISGGRLKEFFVRHGTTRDRALIDPKWFKNNGAIRESMKGEGRTLLQQRMRQTTYKSVLPRLLRYEDRNSMAHSIESRVPFLTFDFANFLATLPDEAFISNSGQTKRGLRDAMRGIVPNEILDRKDKLGFSTPADLITIAQHEIRSRLDSESIAGRWGFFREARNSRLLDAKVDSDRDAQQIWRTFTFLLWAEMFEVHV